MNTKSNQQDNSVQTLFANDNASEAGKSNLVNTALIDKYNLNGPRYTSYPTALELKDKALSVTTIENALANSDNDELSVYVHIPFCQQLCYYCGCHKYLARNTDKSDPYVDDILAELDLWAASFKQSKVAQVHFGGGTPTFISNELIAQIMDKIKGMYQVQDDAEISIEVDPRTCDAVRIKQLIEAGFNRFSFGIQDFNADTQEAINRIQSLESIKAIVDELNLYPQISFNFDLIYGLPKQNQATFTETVAKVINLKPNRISVFNYAHMPDRFAEQRKMDASTLPGVEEKLAMQVNTIEQLTKAGYVYLGIDHYALPDDPLAVEQSKNTLHRNFQGYTTHGHCDLLGVGISSISQVGDLIFQNEKHLSNYQKQIKSGEIAVVKSLSKTNEDKKRWHIIKQLICNMKLDISEFNKTFDTDFNAHYQSEISALQTYVDDGLVSISENEINISMQGRLFTRLICKTFDSYSQIPIKQDNFSKAI